jgi:hypothetical protein
MVSLNKLRACTTHGRRVVCTTSNLSYRQMYRQLVQPTDTESVCKLFNVLHVAKINYKCIVYTVV